MTGGAYTVCVVLEIDALPEGGDVKLPTYWGGTSFNSAWLWRVYADGHIDLWSNQAVCASPPGVFEPGVPVWVGTRYNTGGEVELLWRRLTDTALDSDLSAVDGITINPAVAWWGSGPDFSETWPGVMGHARAWTGDLDDEELLAESLSKTAVREDDLHGAWEMVDADTVEDDVSGEGNHLTLVLGGGDIDDAPPFALEPEPPPELTITATAEPAEMQASLDRAPNTLTITATAPATEMSVTAERPITSIEITATAPATQMAAQMEVTQPPSELTITATAPATTAEVILDSAADAPQVVITATAPATEMGLTGIGGPATLTITGHVAPTRMGMEVGTLEPPVARTRAQIALDADQDRPASWTWTTLEGRLLSSTPISVTRGHTSESQAHRPPPAQVELPLRNHDGALSPDNRNSPWWPHIREGLPVRVQRWHHGSWHTRMTGHLDAIQLREDHYSTDGTATAFLSVSGELERMAQGAPALRSPMTRLATSPANGPRLIAGWPHEDGTDATRSISPLPGVAPAIMSMPRASDDTLAGSAPLPHTSSGPGGWSCPIPSGPMLGSWHCDWTMRIDSPPEGVLLWPMMVIPVVGSAAAQFIVWLSPILGGQVWLGLRDSSGRSIHTQSQSLDDRAWGWVHWRLECSQVSPTHTQWRITWMPHDSGVVFGFSGTFSSQPGRPLSMDNLWRGDQLPVDGVSVGHMWVGVDRIRGWLIPADRGWHGEPAQQRFWRLCSEEGVRSQLIGPPGRSPQMGIQRSDVPLLDLLEEAAAAGGLLHELPAGGIGMRTTEDVLGQDPLIIPHEALTLPLAPVLDTQTTANDVTTQIPSGSKVQLVDEPHRRAVGHFATTIDRNLHRDDQLRHHASWRLTEGTQSRTRVSQITVDLTRQPDLATSILALAHGDRVTVPEVSATIPPIDMLVTGVSEELGEVTWRATLTGRPAGIWSPGVWSSRTNPAVGRGRWDSRDTRLADETDDQTATVDVVSTGVPWINSVDHAALMGIGVEMGRELATVTGITPPASTIITEPGVVDQFARTVPTGWGTSDTGHDWQPWGTGDWTTSVTPADGAMIVTGTQGTVRPTLTTGPPVRDSEVLALVDVDDTEAEVIPWELHVVSRLINADQGYRATLSFEPGGLLVARWQSQSTTIGPYQDRDRWWVRLRIEGHTGWMSVWPDGTTEPGEWMLTGTVPPTDRQPAGQLGIALDVNLFQAARPVVRVREITQTVLTPAHAQTMTLTRPTPSTHPPATRLRVAEQDRWRWAAPGAHHHAAP